MDNEVYKLRPIAIYLPQYHPVPENDEWWGKGFTEWTNVAKAKPLFKNHYQPQLPADLGFYDLRLAETREAQARMAKAYGIHGFCYYHYWFNGKRILEKPFQEVYESNKPDFPFMLCWANENWTRRWDGKEHEILLEQHYSEEDDRLHIKSLLPYFKDSRYIKINNRPVIAIYKSAMLPHAKQTIDLWREEAKKEGINLYICRFENDEYNGKEFMECGFDAAIEFQPFSSKLNEYNRIRKTQIKKWKLKTRLLYKFYSLIKASKKSAAIKEKHSHGTYLDYNHFVDHIMTCPEKKNDYLLFPGAMPAWDNTARKGINSFMFRNCSPSKFKEWLYFLTINFLPPSIEENLIFINAWNEWAEGCHLEPCQKYKSEYLEAVKEVFIKLIENK